MRAFDRSTQRRRTDSVNVVRWQTDSRRADSCIKEREQDMRCTHCGTELRAQGRFCTQCGAPKPAEAEGFTWAARQMSRLVARRRAGELDDAAFSQVRDGFMIHDDAGRSWVPNSDGSWYCYEGTDWVIRQPPVSLEKPAVTEAVSPSRDAPSRRSRAQSRPVPQPVIDTDQSARNAGQTAQKKRKRGLVVRAALGLLALLVACGAWWVWSLLNETPRATRIPPSPTSSVPTRTLPTLDRATPSPNLALTLGNRVEVISEMVDSSGGAITIDEPGSPIDGLVIRVPQGAYGEETEFEVTYAPIDEHVLGDEVTVLTPLISIENGGDYSQEFMIVTIPASIPEGHFAMPFYYNDGTGNFEAIPVVDQDNDSLIVVTRHFSVFTLLSIEKEKLRHLDIETGFTPGEDDWNLLTPALIYGTARLLQRHDHECHMVLFQGEACHGGSPLEAEHERTWRGQRNSQLLAGRFVGHPTLLFCTGEWRQSHRLDHQ